MKPWPSTDRSGPDRATGEYVGRTAQEALSKAAAALGPSAELRCWKTRRGGVGGFFATEVYVAGSTPPQGAERERNRPRRKPTDGTARARSDAGSPEPDASPSAPDDGAPDALTMLAEGTTDQVSIHNGAVSPAAFDALLAEAEAALGQDPAQPADTHDTANVGTDNTGVDNTGVDNGATDSAVLRASTARRAPEPWRIPDLCARLRALGVPDAYLPPGERPTLDALASAMGTLPDAAAFADGPGAIVLVVGGHDLVEPTAALLARELGLGRRDLVRCDVQRSDANANDNDNDNGGGGHAAGRTAAKVNAAVRVAKRRATGLISLVVLTTSPDADGSAAAADAIDCLRPHTVLAAVDASVKRVDTERWLHGVGSVDALAVWGLDATRTPGELLGAAPIAYADGTMCTAISWTAILLARLAGDDAA
jgi:hypothetical protein